MSIVVYPMCFLDFYPRSPCGERRAVGLARLLTCQFLSTLSLRRATRLGLLGWLRTLISIHALLAESDALSLPFGAVWIISIHALLAESDPYQREIDQKSSNFYPRSPCGERPAAKNGSTRSNNFYPRSPCGERLPWALQS